MTVAPKNPHVRAVESWLTQLLELTRSGQEAVTKARLATLAVILAGDFAASDFTRTSLQAVAVQCEFFPVYSEIKRMLGDFWKARFASLGLPETSARVDDWLLDRVLEGCSHRPGPALTGWLEGKGVLREQISDRLLASTASADWRDGNKVLAAAQSLDGHPMRLILGRMVASLVRRHAPLNLGYLPPEFHSVAA